MQYKEHIIKLFNDGVLTLASAEWYNKKGYALIVKNGKVVDIVKEQQEV